MKLAKQLLMAATVVVATPASAQVPGTGPLQQTPGSTHYDDCCSLKEPIGPVNAPINPSIDTTSKSNSQIQEEHSLGLAAQFEDALKSPPPSQPMYNLGDARLPAQSTAEREKKSNEAFLRKPDALSPSLTERMCKVVEQYIDTTGPQEVAKIPEECKQTPKAPSQTLDLSR